MADGTAGKVYTRLPGIENSNSHGARPVCQIISMIKWIQNSRLLMKYCLSGGTAGRARPPSNVAWDRGEPPLKREIENGGFGLI
jgi:hypothetical protein